MPVKVVGTTDAGGGVFRAGLWLPRERLPWGLYEDRSGTAAGGVTNSDSPFSHPRVTMPPQAKAVPNVYKIQPIVASHIPAGSTYTRPIIVYNPRDSPTLAITEVRRRKGLCVSGVPRVLREGLYL